MLYRSGMLWPHYPLKKSIWDQLEWFVTHVNPWFDRGNNFIVGSDAGVNAFDNANGNTGGGNSFRVVLLYYDN